MNFNIPLIYAIHWERLYVHVELGRMGATVTLQTHDLKSLKHYLCICLFIPINNFCPSKFLKM